MPLYALIWVKDPAGADQSQQTMVASAALIPQGVATWVNMPTGGVTAFSPEQTIVPSDLRPHV